MIFCAPSDESNDCAQVKIAVDLLPHKMERVDARPHVGAASCDAVLGGGGVIGCGARLWGHADIPMRLEDSQYGRSFLRTNRQRAQESGERSQCGKDLSYATVEFH